MNNEKKSIEQLGNEVAELRQRLAKLETDSRRVEEELQESKASMQSILKAAPVGVGLVHDRVLHWVSDHMNEMLGYSGDELIGKSARVLYENDEEFKRVGREEYDQIDEEISQNKYREIYVADSLPLFPHH